MISSYKVNGSKIEIKTPYCGAVIEQCRRWAGKWDKGLSAWVVPANRLAAVQEKLGKDLEDQVEVRVRCALEEKPAKTFDDGSVQEFRAARPGYEVENNAYALGWYVLASRGSRDSSADVYADLVEGEIPDSGGSVKNPTVSGKGCAFQLWVPRDFAAARGLEIVTDPKGTTEPTEPANPLAAFSDAEIGAEFKRRGLST